MVAITTNAFIQATRHGYGSSLTKSKLKNDISRFPLSSLKLGNAAIRFRGPCSERPNNYSKSVAVSSTTISGPGEIQNAEQDTADNLDTSVSSEAFVVRVQNNSEHPSYSVVELQGADQEKLLADVTEVFAALNINVKEATAKTHASRVLDVFIVNDEETDSALSEEQLVSLKAAILKKLEHRNRIKSTEIDPKLAEQIEFLHSTLENVLLNFGDSKILEAAKFLNEGFRELRDAENPRKRAGLLRYIEKMDAPTLTGVVRLYYLYSSLLNVADDAHSHRQRRDQVWASRNATPLWYASFDHTLRMFRQFGVSAEEVQSLMNRTEYNPVLTAHPTEARRREVLQCLYRIFTLCANREDPRLSRAQKAEIEAEVQAEVEVLWHTDEMRSKKPSVLEEVQTGLDYFRFSLFDAVCTTYRYAENAIRAVYPETEIKVPSFIKFGSWIGGDRDGNPFVLPETTEIAALLQSRLILAEYIRRCRKCQDILTQSTLICNVSEPLLQSLAEDSEILLKVAPIRHEVSLFETEPYRLKLRAMRHRLEQKMRKTNAKLREYSKQLENAEWLIDLEYNLEDLPGIDPSVDSYSSEKEFLADLKLIESSLIENGDEKLCESKLKDLIRLAETFGFYLCALDVRQESNIHSEAVEECLSLLGCQEKYSSLDTSSRVQLLTEYLVESPASYERLQEMYSKMSNSTRQVVRVLESWANIIDEVSPKGLASYVISMTRNASHVLEVYFLGWFVNRNLVALNGDKWTVRMVVTPLFETIPDLEEMPAALSELVANETYKQILKASGNIQEIMLGYSDSCKDGGIAASAYNLYKAQQVIQRLSTEAGVGARIFHGRGGTVGRGAGPAHESVLAQPPGSVNGQIKFTEQGEVITYRYGNSQTAVYELSVGITGLLKASHPATRYTDDIPDEYFAIMEEIVAAAERSYRELTDETEGFYDYFYEATVVSEIGLMNIGSRPARRKAAIRDKSSLRAIPWVFGWAQARHTLPGWYGIGSGLLAYTSNRPDRIVKLQNMYQDWPFFRTFLSNVQMAVYKASMEIAQEYARLCQNRITQSLVYDLVRTEHELTKSQILMVAQLNFLQEDNIIFKRSFDSRREYLDPLNHIQIILLGRRRDPQISPEDHQLWEKPLLRTIKAIASNMRNTG